MIDQWRGRFSRTLTSLKALYRWLAQRWVTHPLLFAAAPIVSLAAHNAQEINPLAALRSMAILVVGTQFAMLVLQKWVPDKQRSALLCSLFILLFFSYGHVYFGLVTQSSLAFFSRLGLIGNHGVLGIVWVFFFAIFVLGILRSRRRWEAIGRLMTIMALVTLLLPLIQTIAFELQRTRPWPGLPSPILTTEAESAKRKPDIYYIVLDGYGRADTLEALYAFDNQSFIKLLQDQGFFVADQSRSNYVQTSLSLASSLNMEYIDTLLNTYGEAEDPRLSLARMIRSNSAQHFLQTQGYKTVAFASGYRPTELDAGEHYYTAPQRYINPLEGLLLETSAFIAFQALTERMGVPTYYPGYQSHRNLVTFVLDNIPAVVSLPGPKFVFAHVVIPHPPFIFGPNGEEVPHDFRFNFMDGNAYQGTLEQYRSGYRDQLTYLNERMEGIIASILANSPQPPIIIIQGDHGPGLYLDYQSADKTNLDERLGILNAYFLPGYPLDRMSVDLTPVNTFRLIFSHYFDADLPALSDRSYYSTWDEPFIFLEAPPTPTQ